MKKIFAILLTLVLLFAVFAAVAEQPDGSKVKVLEGNYAEMIQNVPFEGGYYGFCITPELPGAKEGDIFDVTGTTGNVFDAAGTEDVSNIVKCALLEGFTYYFPVTTYLYSDGPYKMNSQGANNFYSTIWHILGAYDSEPTEKIAEIIAAAEARAAREQIPDTYTEIYTIDGIGSRSITFDFKAFLTRNAGEQQNFFGFRALSASAATESTPLPTITPAPNPPSGEDTDDNESGGNESGGNESGGNESGGNGSGGNGSGGNESGGNESGGNESGGGNPGEVEPALPETGDNANIGLWLSLLVVSGAAMFAFKRKSA